MKKCQACFEQYATWSWQPFGPNDDPKTFGPLNNHYRGFPVVTICQSCHDFMVESDGAVTFKFKGHTYLYKNGKVTVVGGLWNGGGCAWNDDGSGDATMIMQDSHKPHADCVAIVAAENLVSLFIAAPEMLAALQGAVTILDEIEDRLNTQGKLKLFDVRAAIRKATEETP